MKATWMIMGLGLGMALAGCATHQPQATADTYNNDGYVANAPHWYYHPHHHWSDGYSFNYDPTDPDKLAPTMGLDSQFPPAPHPWLREQYQ